MKRLIPLLAVALAAAGLSVVVALAVPTTVCSAPQQGPSEPPAGSVTVPAGDNSGIQWAAGTTYWLAPGVHTLSGQYGQIIPGSDSTFVGAPGAVLDGRGINQYAFTQRASNVTIKHLEIRGFVAPQNEGVVNHDSGDDWVIEHNNVHHNSGAALMAGPNQVVRANCLKDNGQYGMNAYDGDMNITTMLVEGNEITGNNTDDWESQIPGCGCSGGVKFWAVNGATVRDNWVHHNHGAGLWADNNNNDFLFENNLFEANEGIALFYEQGYNATIRNNTFLSNGWVQGREFANRGDNFPIGAIYLSESGGDSRIPARTDRIEVTGNTFTNNWSGVVLWENADRFCNSPANTGSDCTLVLGIHNQSRCTQPGIASEPLYSDCRWKTQNVDIHHNTFAYDPSVIPGSRAGFSGRQAVFSNWGTYPSWSPYMGNVVQQAITFDQNNTWHDNAYSGPWGFLAWDTGRSLTWEQWRGEPYNQDVGSTFGTPPTTTTAAPTPTTTPAPTTAPTLPSVHLTFEGGTDQHVAWYGSSVTQTSKKPLYGTGSLLLESTEPFSGVELGNWPGFEIQGGHSYNLDFEYVTGSQMPDFTWTVVWSDTDGNALRTDTFLVPRTPSHREFAASVAAPDGATRVRWTFTWEAQDLKRSWVKIDELYIY